MNKLNVDHVNYSVIIDDEKPYSVCEDFISRDTELVTAWKILQRYPKPNHLSVYQHYINCCKSLGIEDIVDKINQMIVVDFIIANEDRHLNNFGLVRNANTLEWIDVAQIFDSGSSLGYDKVTPNMDKQSLIVCKPFKKTYFEQLKLVTSFDWIDFDALKNIDNEILGILNDADDNLIDDARKQKIVSSINQRIEYIHNLALEKTWQINDNINEDVENDIAEDYSSFDIELLPQTMEILETMGEQIKIARLRRDLSAELVAERANISRATLWNIEKGSPSVAIGNYAAVLHALNNMDRDLLKVAKDDEFGRKLQDLNISTKKRASNKEK